MSPDFFSLNWFKSSEVSGRAKEEFNSASYEKEDDFRMHSKSLLATLYILTVEIIDCIVNNKRFKSIYLRVRAIVLNYSSVTIPIFSDSFNTNAP